MLLQSVCAHMMRVARITVPLFAVALTACAATRLPNDPVTPTTAPAPTTLAATGLYSDFASRTIAVANRPYTPGFTLWSDGAEKSRWIYLPPSTTIDVSDIREWQFPIGTKVWKEFRLDGQRIETRMLWKRDTHDWQMVTYVWASDQSTATLATEAMPPPVPFPGTASYEVPVTQCHTCHDSKPDAVLGFEAALLAAPEADGMTWDRLNDEGLVTAAAPLPTTAALQFLGRGTAVERAAVGYLHVNCGITCHHATSGTTTPFFSRLEPGANGALPSTIDLTSIFTTAINQQSTFTPKGVALGSDYRIRPTDPSRSTVFYRMNVRGSEQMPPVVSHIVDASGVATVQSWIDAMTSAPYPAPAN